MQILNARASEIRHRLVAVPGKFRSTGTRALGGTMNRRDTKSAEENQKQKGRFLESLELAKNQVQWDHEP